MRTRITLACTQCKQRNYNTTKDKKAHPDRMETKKYCRFCKTHTIHKETKQLSLTQAHVVHMKGVQMGDSVKTDKAPKKDKKEQKKTSFFKGVKAEFKKISWPDKNKLFKQSVAVVCISVVLGMIITLLDTILQFCINFLTM